MSAFATISMPIPAKPAAATISNDSSTERSLPSGRRNSMAHNDWKISSFCMTGGFASAPCLCRSNPCAVVRVVGHFPAAGELRDRLMLELEIAHGRRLNTRLGDDRLVQFG